jgi:hypothetical protein
MLNIKNTHTGRCFIVGNGPSLTVEDLETLKNEVTFASNRIYGIFPKTNWRPTYYVSQDFNVLNEIKDNLFDVSNQCSMMILSGNIMRVYPCKLKKKDNVKFVYMDKQENIPFDIDVINGIHNVINVTYTMIELALFMGFEEIYLIGVDNSYVIKQNEKGETVIDDISSHFAGMAPLNYETKVIINSNGGYRDKSTEAYYDIAKYLQGRKQNVFNATRGGKLEVFQRVNFDEVFNN